MTGTVVLQGGGPFVANDDLDRRVLAKAGVDRIVMLPTAEAFEQPQDMVNTALEWGARVGIAVELASIPEKIRGYGHVKEAHVKTAKACESDLMTAFRDPAQRQTAQVSTSQVSQLVEQNGCAFLPVEDRPEVGRQHQPGPKQADDHRASAPGDHSDGRRRNVECRRCDCHFANDVGRNAKFYRQFVFLADSPGGEANDRRDSGSVKRR